MKYISVDIETTGLDRNRDQILEFGAIIEDTNDIKNYEDIPKFEAIFAYDRLEGSPYALSLNIRLIDIIKKYQSLKGKDKIVYKRENNIYEIGEKNEYGISTHIEFIQKFKKFLLDNDFEDKKITMAGKNFASFDGQFLKNIGFYRDVRVSHKSIDPATLYVDWKKDTELPSLEVCKKRAGLEDTEITHKAIDDAWDVIRVLRKKY
jgi:DNA polymerase III alpha subunit (gram-positive type)